MGGVCGDCTSKTQHLIPKVVFSALLLITEVAVTTVDVLTNLVRASVLLAESVNCGAEVSVRTTINGR